ncbi:MAG TPA: hypothetical protein VN612_03565 [Acidobacteriaceae bacterium]|nr:hypothetical protein [Acidobacteriaceae bacterium]
MPLLSQQTLRRLLALATLTLFSAALALAQDAPRQSRDPARPPASSLVHSASYNTPKLTEWNSLTEINPSGRLFVVTRADPTHRHTCRVQSFSLDQLICKGHRRSAFRAQDVAALIVPGNHISQRIWLAIGNAELGAAIWGTIVLAPVCPLCAAATAFGAFSALGFAATTLMCDNVPDRLLYLAPSQTLQVKLRY